MSEVFALECVIEKARQDSGAVCAHSTWLLSGKVRENDGFGGWNVRMASEFQTWKQSVLKKTNLKSGCLYGCSPLCLLALSGTAAGAMLLLWVAGSLLCLSCLAEAA